MVYSTRRFVLSLALCYFILVFFSPFSIAITSLGEERANRSAFRTFDLRLFGFVCFLFLLVSGKGCGLLIVALPGLFTYLFSTVQIFYLIEMFKQFFREQCHCTFLSNVTGVQQVLHEPNVTPSLPSLRDNVNAYKYCKHIIA